MKEKVKAALDKIRPNLVGGNVILEDVTDFIVKLKLQLPSCGATMTRELLEETVEDLLLAELPEIKQVIVE